MRIFITSFLSIGLFIIFNFTISVKLNTAINIRLNNGIRLKLIQEDRDVDSVEEASDSVFEKDINEDSSIINELMERYETEEN
jgi:hypothetical protein